MNYCTRAQNRKPTDHRCIVQRTLAAIVLVLSPLLLPMRTIAQVLDTLPVQRPSQMEGTRFLVSFMKNEITIQPSGLRLRVLVASAYPNTITVVYPDGRQQSVRLSAGETLPLLLADTFEVRQSEMPLRRAVEIHSELPVSVFAMSSQYTTSDSYTALPVDLWGTEYVVVSLPNDTYGDGLGTPVDSLDIRQSEFMIIAAENGTEIEFKPTAPTENGKQPGTWHSVMLDAGQCYLVKAYPSQQGTGDLSGTLIRSNKPIGVLAGHVRASVPIGLPQRLDSKDHLCEMLLPKSLLGSSYVTVPFATGGRIPAGDYLRAVAIEPDTRITVYTERADLTFVLASEGDTLTLPGVNSPTWWYSTKPFVLAQFMTTGTVANSIMFDPAMAIAMPIGRYVSRAVFQAPANLTDATFSRQFDRHWINVICDERASRSLKLDGAVVANTIAPELATQKFRSSGMFWAQIPVSPGVHMLEADSGVFTGVLYGMGYTDSYAHPIGVTSFVGRDTIVPSLSVRDSCGWLIGIARDAAGSGLAYVTIEPDSTTNYELHVTSLADGMGFRAALGDPYRDAKIAIVVRDRAGNGVRYRYRYAAPVVDIVPRPLRLTANAMGQQLCQDAILRNFSFRDTLIVAAASLVGSSGGMFSVTGTFPLVCPPRREVKVTVCYTAALEGEQRDTLVWDVGCGRTFRQPLQGRTPLPELTIADADFGEVFVGDSVCRELAIVNTGTEPVTVTEVQLADAVFRAFAPTLPSLLAPGDTLRIRVCFTPGDTGSVLATMTIVNDKQLDVRARLTGRGIRAILVAKSLDCGLRRVGVRFDTVARIVNRGSADATLTFRSQTGDRASFLHSLQAGDRLIVPRYGVATIPIRFAPQGIGSVTSWLEFSSGDSTTLTVALSGVGTLPALSMRDTTLGPVTVGDRRPYGVVVLRSEGNEELTLDSMWLDGPDRTSFWFQQTPSFPIRVKPDSELVVPIVFEPSRAGLHSVSMHVVHDARPNYLRATASSAIWGIGVARDSSGGGGPTDTTEITDTLDFRFDVEYDPNPPRCSELPITLIVTNTGNTTVRITAAELIEGSTRTSIRQRFPDSLMSGEQLRIKITIPPVQMRRDLLVRIVANDTIVRQRLVRIVPNDGLLRFMIEDVQGSIDSTVSLRVQGLLTVGLAVPFDVGVDITLPDLIAEYRGGIGLPVSIHSDGALLQTTASIAFDGPMLRCRWTLPAFTDTCRWELAVPLHLLYALVPTGDVVGYFSAGPCFRSDTARAVITTDRVCGHSLRAVRLDGFALVNIAPNPIGSSVHVEVDVYSPQQLRLQATDLAGRRIFIGQTERLDVGRRVVIFDTEHLPSGWYAFIVESADGRGYVECCFLKH